MDYVRSWNVAVPAVLVSDGGYPHHVYFMPARSANILQPISTRCVITASRAPFGPAPASLIALPAYPSLSLIDNLLFATIGANACFAAFHGDPSRVRAREGHQGLILLSWALRVSDTLKNIIGSNLKSINIF